MLTEEQKRQIPDLVAQGEGWASIARKIGAASGDQVRKWYRRWQARQQVLESDPLEEVQEEREKEREAWAKRQVTLLTKVRAFQEELRDALRSVASVAPVPAPAKVPALIPGNTDPETILLLIGDVHMGALEHDKFGHAQSVGITVYQWRRLMHSTLKLIGLEQCAHPIRRVHVLFLGDLVEGYLRPSHAFRLAVEPPVQAVFMGRLVAEYLLTLLSCLPEGDGPSVIAEFIDGNHDRVTMQPGLASLSELTPKGYTWIVGEYVRAVCGEAIRSGRMRLVNHDTLMAISDVEGWPVIWEHGSGIRSSSGGIPVTGLKNAANALLQESFDLGMKPFLLYVIGHYHNPNTIHFHGRSEIIMNGAFPAVTHYELSLHKAPCVPSQRLLSVHKRQGKTSDRPVWLEVPDELKLDLVAINDLDEADRYLQKKGVFSSSR